MTPHARSTDPLTSHEAAKSVDDGVVKQSQRDVYRILRAIGPSTDERLAFEFGQAVARLEVAQQTDSSLRTRRHELVELGWVVVDSEDGRTATGRRARVWRAMTAEERNDRQQEAAEDRRAAAALTAEEPQALTPEIPPPPATRSAIFGWDD